MRFVVVLCSATLALLAVGCEGGNSGAPAKLRTPCTNDATATAIVGTNVAGQAVPYATRLAESGKFILPVDDEPTCRIRSVILQPQDLGADWGLAEGSVSSTGIDQVFREGSSECGVPLSNLLAGLEATYQRGSSADSTADQTAAAFPERIDLAILVFRPGSAEEFMSATRADCKLDFTPEAGSTPVPARARAVVFPTIADDTIAYTRTVIDPEDEIEVFVRRGDVVEQMVLVGDGKSLSQLERFARQQDAKIEAAYSYLPVTPAAAITPSPTLDSSSTQAIVASVLPGDADLPIHWLASHEDSSSIGPSLHFCRDAEPLPPGSHRAAASYDGGAGAGENHSIDVGVAVYDAGDADALMRSVTSGSAFSDGCGGSVRSIDVTWKLERLDLPQLGDASVAWRATATHVPSSGRPTGAPLVSDIELDFEVIRRANVIAIVVTGRDVPRYEDLEFIEQQYVNELMTFAGIIDTKLTAAVRRLPSQ